MKLSLLNIGSVLRKKVVGRFVVESSKARRIKSARRRTTAICLSKISFEARTLYLR